jgi:hypothetical protein
MPPPRPFAAALALLVACGDSAPPTPVVELAPGADTVSTGYAEIVDGEWLGGGRWAVVAPLDVTVGIIDLDRRNVVPLGGEGTSDIRNPAVLFLTADTLYVGDWGLRRVACGPARASSSVPFRRPICSVVRSRRRGMPPGAGMPSSSRYREGMAAAIASPRPSWPQPRSSSGSTRWPGWRRSTSRR